MNDIIFHKHHIIPKHMEGSNDPSNIIKVNVPLHAFLHKLLWEQYGHWQDYCAWKLLSGEMSKEDFYRKRMEENKENLRRINKGNKYRLGKTFSELSKEKMSNSHKGIPLSEQHKKGLSNAH